MSESERCPECLYPTWDDVHRFVCARALAAEARVGVLEADAAVSRVIVEKLEAFHAELIASDDPEDWTHASAVDSMLYLVGKGPTAETLKAGDPNWKPTVQAALAAPTAQPEQEHDDE